LLGIVGAAWGRDSSKRAYSLSIFHKALGVVAALQLGTMISLGFSGWYMP